MKKIILNLILVLAFLSCKEETRIKVKEAGKAVGMEAKVALDSVKSKTNKAVDTANVKQKFKTALKKGAEKVEEAAKKVKDSL